MQTIDLNNFTPSQIVTAFLIVIAVLIVVATVIIPKVLSGYKNIKSTIEPIKKRKELKERQEKQIEINKQNIEQINNKVDNLIDTLDSFITDNKETNEKIIQSVQQLQEAQEKDKLEAYRSEILDFANSCKNGRRHTANEFLHIISLGSNYDHIIEDKHMENGVFEVEFEYIKRVYNKCLDENKFLDCSESEDD